MTSLSERTQRTNGLGARVGEIPDIQVACVVMADGSVARGRLYRSQGSRTLDMLNRTGELFVAMTSVTLTLPDGTEQLPFMAINKAHIVRVIEAADVD
jgi:hypothetical protein